MTPYEIHPQHKRENPEPHEAANPMPWVVVLLTALLLAFGVTYIARSAIVGAPTWGDGRAAAELRGAAAAATGAAVDGAAVDGAAVYASRCVACHQAGGAGLPGIFPPLAGSEWVSGKETMLAALVLHGVEGTLTVKGSSYAGAMPAFGGQLNDAKLAAVLTHIRGQWGNGAPAVSADTVAAVRAQTAARRKPFNGDAELGPLK